MQQAWKLYFEGLAFPKDPQCRNEWWIFWRRVAGGLAAGKQAQMYQQVWPHVQASKSSKKKPSAEFLKHLRPGEDVEIWMTLASFERLPSETKVEIGRQLLDKFGKQPPSSRELWALSRLGSRKAVNGPLDRLVPPAEAVAWLQTLLSLDLQPTEHLAYCLVLLAQRTGDRARDVPEEIREQILRWLAQLPDTDRFRELLMNAESSFDQREQAWIMGESLPAGLVLFSSAT
jgi:hypothetical protein